MINLFTEWFPQAALGSWWAEGEKMPGQNQGLAEQITSKTQRDTATEDTGKGLMYPEWTEEETGGGWVVGWKNGIGLAEKGWSRNRESCKEDTEEVQQEGGR